LSAGRILGGRYRLERKVATGGMGEVWEAEHIAVQSRVAIKALLPEALLNNEIVVRLKREAFILGRIRSHHIARVVDYLIDETCGPLLVTEFVEGESLHAVLANKRFSVEEAIELGIEIATGLRELHRASIVHRDLKPANVILQPMEEGKSLPVIVDFGVSRMVHASDEPTENHITAITNRDIAVGTIEFMAPEQILRSSGVTPAADLYALGSLLFRAVTGQNVFGALSRGDFAYAKLTRDAPPLETGRTDKVAVGLATVVGRALERRPADRYDSADEMLADLCLLRDAVRRARARARNPESSVSGVRPIVAKPRPRQSPFSRFRHAKAAMIGGAIAASAVLGMQLGKHSTSSPQGPDVGSGPLASTGPRAVDSVVSSPQTSEVESTSNGAEQPPIELPASAPEPAVQARNGYVTPLTKQRERALLVAIATAAKAPAKRWP